MFAPRPSPDACTWSCRLTRGTAMSECLKVCDFCAPPLMSPSPSGFRIPGSRFKSEKAEAQLWDRNSKRLALADRVDKVLRTHKDVAVGNRRRTQGVVVQIVFCQHFKLG